MTMVVVVRVAVIFLTLLLGMPLLALAQDAAEQQPTAVAPVEEQTQPAPVGAAGPSQVTLKLSEFQDQMLISLQREFPRLPDFFASAHTCRLPGYGPMVTIIIQPPAFFFTAPMLQQLERWQRDAEMRAARIRGQIDQASRLIQLKNKEANLEQQLELEYSTNKKQPKPRVAGLQRDLAEVRQAIQQIENQPVAEVSMTGVEEDDPAAGIDLDKMIQQRYVDLINRVTAGIRTALAQNAPLLKDIGPSDHISIAAHIRENLMTNQEKTVLLVIAGSDIDAFRKGSLSQKQLQDRIQIQLSGE